MQTNILVSLGNIAAVTYKSANTLYANYKLITIPSTCEVIAMKTANELPQSSIAVCAQMNDPVSKLIGNLKKNGASEALVFDGEEFKGVFSHFLMLKSRTHASKDKVANFVIPAAKLIAETPLLAIANIMMDSSIRALPVFTDDRLQKTVDIYGVLKALQEEENLYVELGNAVEPFQGIRPTEKLGRALHQMHNNKCKEIPLVDEEILLTSSSIIEQYHLQHTAERRYGETPNTPEETAQIEISRLLEMPVSNFTSGSVQTVKKDATLTEATRIMCENQTPLLIIKNFGKPIGMVSAESVLKRAADLLTVETGNIHYVGIEKLDLPQLVTAQINEIASVHGQKLWRYFNNIFDIIIHVKEHEKAGNRSRYEVHSRVNYPGATVASQANEWDVLDAVRVSLDKLKSQLKNKYKDHATDSDIDYEAAVGRDIYIPHEEKPSRATS